MGCFYHGVAHEAVIVPALIVGDNQENVGWFSMEGLRQGDEGAQECKNRGEDGPSAGRDAGFDAWCFIHFYKFSKFG